MCEWISVNDDLPENESVIMFVAELNEETGELDSYSFLEGHYFGPPLNWLTSGLGQLEDAFEVTHWMIPEIPQEYATKGK